MTEIGDGFVWKVIVDGPRFSRTWDGREPSMAGAVSAMRQLAWEAFRATPLEDVWGIRVGVAPGTVVEHLLRVTPDDLGLGDDELSGRIESQVARAGEEERERRHRLDAAIGSRTMSARRIPLNSLAEQCGRITAWLDARAIADMVDGADADRIAAARAATGLDWPADLVEFHALAHPTARLTPRGHLFTLDEALAVRGEQIAGRDEFAATVAGGDPFAVATSNGERAGTAAYAFLDAFVPLAGDVDGCYVVDTRPGPRHGCVVDVMDEGDSAPRWHSLPHLLADLAHSLETGARFADLWVPEVVDGTLTWGIP